MGLIFLLGIPRVELLLLRLQNRWYSLRLPVPFVALIDTVSPFGVTTFSWWKAIFTYDFFRNLPFWLYYFLPFWYSHYWKIMKNKVVRIIQEKYPKRIDTQVHEHKHKDYILQVIEWMRTYNPHAYDGRLILYRAKAQGLLRLQFDKGWKGVAENLEIHTIPGHHNNIILKPYVRSLASKINSDLQRVINNVSA